MITIVEILHVLSRSAERESLALVLLIEEDTTLVQNCLGETVLDIGVTIEVRVARTDDGVLGVDTGTIGVGHITVVHHIVILLGINDAHRTQDIELQRLVLLNDRLVIELALELEVSHVQVNGVLVQLIKDIKGGEVAVVTHLGSHGTSGIQREAVGVDIEVTPYLTINDVHILTQGTGGLLVTETVTVQNLEFEFVGNVIDCVSVEGVALNAAALVPSRIEHYRSRGVERTLVGTARNAHRVVLHDVVVEQQVKPVGIAELSLTQEAVAGSLSVGQCILSSLRIVGVDQVIHLTIDTRGAAVHQAGILKPTLLLHLAQDTHLLL